MSYEHTGVRDDITGSNQLYCVATHHPKFNEESYNEYK